MKSNRSNKIQWMPVGRMALHGLTTVLPRIHCGYTDTDSSTPNRVQCGLNAHRLEPQSKALPVKLCTHDAPRHQYTTLCTVCNTRINDLASNIMSNKSHMGITQEWGEKKRGSALLPLRCNCDTVFRGRLFRSIHNQLFHGNIQCLDQTLKNIRARHTVLLLNLLNSDGGDFGIFCESLYRIPTPFAPVSQHNLQVFFVSHILLPIYKTPSFFKSNGYLKESQHKSKTILTQLFLFYYTLDYLLLFCYNKRRVKINKATVWWHWKTKNIVAANSSTKLWTSGVNEPCNPLPIFSISLASKGCQELYAMGMHSERRYVHE